MNLKLALFSALLAATATTSVVAQYTTSPAAFDQNVTPDLIFGTGNANGGFTVKTSTLISSGQPQLEVGLRAKVRYDQFGQPQNIFNSLGNGTYVFSAGAPLINPALALWNFEFSVNTQLPGATNTAQLDDFTFALSIDFDPTAGTNIVTFNPFATSGPFFFDHSFGTNATGNGAGVEATSSADFVTKTQTYNVAQQSWNLGFLNTIFPSAFNPNATGIYDIALSWSNNSGVIGSTAISVQVIPEPATYAVFLSLGALAVVGIRRRMRK